MQGIAEKRSGFFKQRTPTRSSKAAWLRTLADGHSELEQLFNLPPLAIQVGQRQEIISVDRLKAHIGSILVSPAEAASRGRPPKKSVTPSIYSLRHLEAADWGGPVEEWFKYCIFFFNRGVLLWRQ